MTLTYTRHRDTARSGSPGTRGISRSEINTLPSSLARRASMSPRPPGQGLGVRAAVCGAMMALALFWTAAACAGTVNIDLVPVGDAGNVADSRTGYGAVAYPYDIGKFDVTMGQYTAFLNAVATTSDPYGVYSTSMSSATPSYGITRTSVSGGFSYALASTASGNIPVNFVSWGSAARFVNWLQNGEPAGLGEVGGSTETGSYALNGSTGTAALMAVTRSTTAAWVLPTDNEWYKSAYYAAGGTNSSYWIYPTQSNDVPSNALSPSGTNNANHAGLTGAADPLNLLTSVGFFAASPGPYGTFDQGGNVDQWLETPFDTSYREIRGGSWADGGGTLRSYEFTESPPTFSSRGLGFRVAYVPEPSAVELLASAALIGGFVFRRYRSTTRRGVQSGLGTGTRLVFGSGFGASGMRRFMA
jgi:formylglycine-generating enzyme